MIDLELYRFIIRQPVDLAWLPRSNCNSLSRKQGGENEAGGSKGGENRAGGGRA